MLNKILSIRLLQIQRELRSVGFFYTLGILFVLGIILYKLQVRGIAWASDSTIALIIIGLIGSIHFSRNDKVFLATIFQEKAYWVYICEYTLGSFPFVISLILGKTPWVVCMVWLGIFVLAFVQKTTQLLPRKQMVLLKKFIPDQHFEWIAGMRQYQFIILPLYFITLAMSFYDYAPFWLIGILTFCFSGFYQDFEPIQILLLSEVDARTFVKNKWKSHLWLFLKFISPLLLVYGVQYPTYYYVFLPLLLIYLLNFSVFVLNKYKSYIPNQRNTSNSIITGLLFLGAFLPYLFPISLVLVFVFYRKAIKNLSPFLHANA